MAGRFEARDESIRAEYESGELNTTGLAKKHNITRERVRQILEPHGVIAARKAMRANRRRQQAADRALKAEQIEQKKAEAVALVRGGMSQRQAGFKVGLSAGRVSDAVHEAEVISSFGRWRKQQIAMKEAA